MGFTWLSKKRPGWMGICLFDDRVELAHVCRTDGGRPQLKALESYRREGDESAMLARLAREHHLARHRCVTLLRPGEYQLMHVEAPAVPEAELAKALRWQVKDMLETPLDSATVDGFALPAEAAAGARRPQAVAVAAANEVLRRRIAGFAAAGLDLDVIDVPELAQRNVAALLEDENRGLAMLVLDDNGGLLTLTYHGELYAARRIDVGAAQLRAADAERRMQLVERIVLELQRTLDNFDRQFNFITVSRLLVTPIMEVPSLAAELKANLYCAVDELDIGRGLDVGAAPELANPARQAQSLAAIGAALRPEARA